jgi:AcrR family transcriptional regulator
MKRRKRGEETAPAGETPAAGGIERRTGGPAAKPSRRKSPDPKGPRVPRPPSQERSRRRFEAILSAAEALLQNANIEDLSFYDLARKAEISPASVFYLFPSMAAVQLELRKRYDVVLSGLLVDIHHKLTRMRVPTWQEWMRIEAGEARNYYNANRPACEALLGPLLHRDNRLPSLQGNALIGASNLANMRRIFDVPIMPGLERKFAYNCELIEMFWSGSYMARGFIDDVAFEESIRASVGYLRNFLPEMLPLRVQDPDPSGPDPSETEAA